MVLVGRRVFRRVQLRRRLRPLRLGFLQHQLLAKLVLRRVRQLLVVARVFLRQPLLWQFVLWQLVLWQLVLRLLLLSFGGMLWVWRLRRLWNFGLWNFQLRRLWNLELWRSVRLRLWTCLRARLLHGRLRYRRLRNVASRTWRVRNGGTSHAPRSKASAGT
jgi:hypothetical protein